MDRSQIVSLGLIMLGFVWSLIYFVQYGGPAVLTRSEPRTFGVDILQSGSTQLLSWHVSFFGLAYFAGLGTVWVTSGRMPTSVVYRVTIRGCAFASLAFLLVLGITQSLCVYCYVMHAVNLGYWLGIERAPRTHHRLFAPTITLFVSIALVATLLNVIISERDRSLRESLAKSFFEAAQKRPEKGTASSSPRSEATAKSPELIVQADKPQQSDETAAIRQPIRIGTDQAKLRLVVYNDYQSEQCYDIDRDIQELLTKYGDDLSITVRHCPSCTDCNLWLKKNEHPNACRAARVAESAKFLKGDAGFLQMHQWLFRCRGVFSEIELREALVEFNYDDVDRFLITIDLPQISAGVLADIVESRAQGIQGAPAVVLNGSQLAVGRSAHPILRAVSTFADKSNTVNADVDPKASDSPVDLSLLEVFPSQLQLHASSATVRIVHPDGHALGSGAIVALREPFVYVLTASHLIPAAKSVSVQVFSNESYPGPSATYPWARVIASSDVADLAVVRFSTHDPQPSPLAIVPSLDTLGSNDFPVLTVGCDGLTAPPSCLGNSVIDARPIQRTVGNPATFLWELKAESAPGRSGGPLVDRRGFLIGIASGNSQGHSYFTHAHEIYSFLDQHGLQGLYAITNAAK